MARLTGDDEVIKKLRDIAKRVSKKYEGNVVVGYEAAYAVYVHEDLTASHPNGGQAKYLEQPARTKAKEIREVVNAAMARGATVEKALFMGGLKLQRESQLLVPVDTGYLRASAFTKIM